MFPSARNSLQRWNDVKIPVPIGVTIYNVMGKLTTPRSTIGEDGDDHNHNKNHKWFRPQYEVTLLPLLRLEIVVEEENGQIRTIYSSRFIQWSIQPTWEHLEENLDLEGEWWRGEIYKQMLLRIIQVDDEQNSNKEEQGHKEEPSIFLEMALHPSQLERVDKIPSSLPPNSLMVHFSDSRTRCATSLFQLLLKHQLAEVTPLEDFSRFEDDVFSTLDAVAHTQNRRPRADSFSVLLDPNDEFNSQLIDEFDGPDELAEIPFKYTEETVVEADSARERSRLLALIAKEESSLEQDKNFLKEEHRHLTSMLNEAREIERQIQMVHDEIQVKSALLRRDEFRKEAQHMRLLKELQAVYPITLDSQKGFLIRSLRLPVDIYTTMVPEEETSAALAFCCHTVFLMAKYLSISMRYRLFCNSSRSAIQLDGNTFLPLFTSRSVEREHLDRAMGLLGSNVDCILLSLGITFTPKSHILARLKRIYDHVIDGEIVLIENGVH